MSEWNFFYRDSHDRDRISPSVSSKETALAQEPHVSPHGV